LLTGLDAIAQLAGGKVMPIYLEGRLIPVQNDISRELGLSANQVVRAVIEQRPEGLIILINGRPVDLPKQLRFRPGDVIWLKAFESPKGLTLQVTPPPASAVTTPRDTSQGLSPMVASLFAQPASFSGLLSLFSSSGGLASLASYAQASGGLGPLSLFLQASPSMARLTGEQVKASMLRSGLFTESRLLAGQSVKSDVKVALREMALRLAQAPRGAADSLRQAAESAVRELESSQADALQASTNREFLLNFMLPFRDAEPVFVSIHRPPRTQEDQDPLLTVNLHTVSETLGEVWMKTVVRQKNLLEITMWALQADTASRAEKARAELSAELESAGLSMTSLAVFHGRRPEEPSQSRVAEHGAVFDQSA
jgi:hypothetical protein